MVFVLSMGLPTLAQREMGTSFAILAFSHQHVFIFCVYTDLLPSASYLVSELFQHPVRSLRIEHPQKFMPILAQIPSVHQMEALHYVWGEQVGGAAGEK